ncbi:MAG: Gfo/Idh/MocA family oxidoreductase [Acidobacteriaceae bacterium]
MPALRLAVIGTGAFGRNHLRVYRELSLAAPHEVQLAAAVDPDPTARAEVASRYNIPTFASLAELLASATAIDAASVCVPTLHHAEAAEQLLQAGVDVLIEKPFAASLAEADRVLALAAALGRIVQIGHLERFNPAVTAVEPLLNRPMFFEAHRLSIFTPRSLDVDVVLDLMIHDLDIVLQLANSPVRELRAVGLPVLSRKVDIANVRVEFDSGCVANFTASRISTEQVRKLRFFQPRQYLSLDFARQELLTIDVANLSQNPGAPCPDSRTWDSMPPMLPVDAPHPSAGLNLQKFSVEKSEPLRLELENFLAAVRTRSTPRVTGAQGRAALALALEINAAIAAHAHRAGLT